VSIIFAWLLLLCILLEYSIASTCSVPWSCLSQYAYNHCLERLSFVTEQVAEHTNGTIGALLNA
jgi:hypothetical protein